MLLFNNSFKLHRLSYLYQKTCTRLLSSPSSSWSLSSSKLNSSMETFIEHKQYQKAIDLFDQHSQSHSDTSMNMAITACTRLKDYQRGLNIVKQLSPQALNNHSIRNSLFHLYIQSKDFDNAHRIFSTIKYKSNWTYTMMFKGFVSNEMSEKVLDFVDTMTIQPNEYTLAIVFKACAQVNDERAKKIGNRLLNQMSDGLRKDVVLMNSAISMLMSFGDVPRAEQFFGSITRKDIVSYGAMMKGYVRNHMSEKALDLFEQMRLTPDDVIYTIIFTACAKLKNERAKKIGKQLLDRKLRNPSTDQIQSVSMIQMLMRFGDVKGAEHLFGLIKEKNVVSYSTMIQGYLENDMSEKALDLFEQMRLIPDDVIYTIIFTACAKLRSERAKKIGKQLLDHKFRNPLTNQFQSVSMIHMLMRFGDVKGAEHLFGLIKEKNVVSYNTMIQGYLENDMNEKALDLFEQMPVDPDDVTYSIIFKVCAQLADERAMKLGNELLRRISNEPTAINVALSSALYMLMRFGDGKRAKHLFESIQNKNMSTYTSMMKAYNLNRQPIQSLQLFQIIKQQDFALDDDIVFILPINACSQISMLATCQSLVAQIPSHFYNKQRISNALVGMWGKAGSVKNAQEIYNTINSPDIVTYTSMVNAFGLNGKGPEAVDLFHQIPHSIRNEISYICVLNSCSHAGLLNAARAIFEQVQVKTKRITTTMIDCLSRLFLFDEAQQLLANYERSNPACSPMYMAIMSGARNCRDAVVCEKVYNSMQRVFPDQKNALISGSILLANVYSSLGDDDQVAIIRSDRRMNYGGKVKPGVTWTEKDGEIVEFGAHDRSHPLSGEIHDEAMQISHELHRYGFRSDPSWITRPLGEDETIQSVLCGHSERLAIAFHFIRGRRPSFIQVTKNLRICGDCHQATKSIALIRQCEIILRDANRVHHFSKDGTCSCQDHF